MKNKVIGIFAPRLNKNHIVFYESLAILFNKEGIDVHFFIDKWFEGKIKLKNGNKYYLNIYQSEISFYLKYITELKKLDYLIVEPDTSKLLFVFFALITNLKYSLVVHNANYWLKPIENLVFKKKIVKILNFIILKKATSIIVVNSNVKKYCIKNSSKITYYFPFNLNIKSNSNTNISEDSKLNIVIPGNISSKRRDYITILQGFKKVLKVRNDLRLVLLGKLDTNDVDIYNSIKEIKDLFPDNIIYWNQFIDEKDFELYIESATLFVAPLNQYLYTDISVEEYGNTKETGVTSFIRKNNKFCLAPDYLLFEEDINHLILKYKDTNEFSKILLGLKNPYNVNPKAINNILYINNLNKEVNLFLNSTL